MFYRTALLVGALTFTVARGALAIEVAGVKVDDQQIVDQQKLVLNGAGIRTRFGFQVYVCALYLKSPEHSTAEVLAVPGAKSVAVTMLREISNDDLGDALLSGLRKNSTPEETRKFGLQLVQMGQLFSTIPRLKKGDTFMLNFAPDTGTTILLNGKPVLDGLPDVAFFNALLRIWLGDNPADSALKPRLLGIAEEASPNRGNFIR